MNSEIINVIISPQHFQQILFEWFDQYGRKHLPWQEQKTAYRIWVSEIMLQQTQVNTVIPYFLKFMQEFPQITMLAQASEDTVLHLWAGLGYYSRARNLHKAAKIIMTEYNGEFPQQLWALEKLPGVGRSTAAAIASIAFNQNTAILDGNVKRVLSRFYGITQPINEKKVETQLWDLADHLMPAKRCADYTQAMMDLGAMVCVRRKPQCSICPLKNHCQALQQNIVDSVPKKKTNKALPTRSATFLIFQLDRHLLLCKRPPMGIWGGLWSFPEINGSPNSSDIINYCQQRLKSASVDYQVLKPFKHTFSHYHLMIFPVLIPIKKPPAKMMEGDCEIWYNLDKPEAIGLPQPVQLIMRTML